MLAAAWVTAIATLVLALGVPVAVATWLGTRRSDRRREQREREEALVREQLEHERALREAIDLLGSEKLEIRIGGIYALERSARDSLRDHPTIMEVLTAFVREHSHGQWPLPVDGDALGPERTIRPDIQAALTVIGRRNATHDLQPIDLSRANLSYANLTGADFTGADFTAADLTAANLTNGDLTGAFLTDADLTRAALIHARLTHANLSRAESPRSIAFGRGPHRRAAPEAGSHRRGLHRRGPHRRGPHRRGPHRRGPQPCGIHWSKLDGRRLASKISGPRRMGSRR